MSEKKETLNERFFNTAYDWAIEKWGRIFITVSVVNIANPQVRSLVKKDPATGVEILVLNISPRSCQLRTLPEGLFFSGRFGGKIEEFVLPWTDIHYLINPDSAESDPVLLYSVFASTPSEVAPTPDEPKPRPSLKVVH